MTGWHYLLLVNIYLLLFYGFYVLLLRKETFFQLNRVYLVAASMLSFFIPMIQSDWVQNLFITKEVQLTIYKSPLIVYQFKPIQHTQVTIGQLLVVIYLAGMLFLIGRFIWQMFVLNKIINQPDAAVSYSFFKKIRLVPGQADNHIIAEHERVHANQWHSADVLLIEAVMIVNWFNPVVYLYRFAIKHIHEYIADRHAVKSGTNKGDYALLLLSQTFNTPVHKLVNPFYNHSLLKQRIKMLQKNKSNRIALVKYGLSAPLFILMLVLSSATLSNSKTINLVNKKAEQVFLTPASAIQPNIILDSTTMVQDAPPVEIKKTPAAVKRVKQPSATDPAVEKNSPVFTSVELVPQFPGGINSFISYLAKNIRYPANARENGIQGRVIISFVVERDGTLSDAHVTRGVADDIDKEALRVIQASPKWEPGVQNGRLVRVAYSVPISFALEESQPDRPSGEVIEQKNDNKAQKIPISSITSIVSKTDTGKKVFKFNIKATGRPLYIIDGKEASDISLIEPNSIESVSVFKDVSTTSIYGPKGKNGVVLLTTKKNPPTPPLILNPQKEPETKH
jgi:TonB family protein